MKNILPNRNTLLVSIGFFLIFFGFGAGQQYLVPLLTLQGREYLAFTSLIVLGLSLPGILLFGKASA